MAIYLDKQTGPHLKYLMKKRLKESPKDFIANRILGAIEADDARKEDQILCFHKFGEYKGDKTCCTRCGGLDVGMGANWTLEAVVGKP